MGTAVRAAAVAWAFSLGAVTPLQSKCFSILNNRSDQPELHAVWVTFFAQVLSLPPLALSFLSASPVRGPRLVACCGGAFGMLGFVQVVAVDIFGFGVTLAVQLCGMLCCSIAVDFAAKPVMSLAKVFGVVLVLSGAVMQFCSDPTNLAPLMTEQAVNPSNYACLLLIVGGGAGWVMQSRLNAEVKEFVGGPLRATFVCNMVTVICHLPLLHDTGILLTAEASDWWIWTITSLLGIFYVFSMSILPSLLSYAATFTTAICGQLICANIIDVLGGALPDSKTQLAFHGAGLMSVLIGTGLSTIAAGDSGSGGLASRDHSHMDEDDKRDKY